MVRLNLEVPEADGPGSPRQVENCDVDYSRSKVCGGGAAGLVSVLQP